NSANRAKNHPIKPPSPPDVTPSHGRSPQKEMLDLEQQRTGGTLIANGNSLQIRQKNREDRQ
ncbi:MAG: hypothetical protein WCH39_25385, partial [Schlesneria sp.]